MAKNNKKSNQKKSVLNKLGGLSKRSKFIVVVLIFAVLGGGYLTYKSFAATPGPKPIISNATALVYGTDTSRGCKSNISTDPAKNNKLVVNIYCPKGGGYTAQNDPTKYSWGPTWPPGYRKICAMMKGVGTFTVKGGAASVKYSINTSTYREYCTFPTALYGITSDESQVMGTVESDVNNPSLVTISYIATYWLPPGSNPSAGGGK